MRITYSQVQKMMPSLLEAIELPRLTNESLKMTIMRPADQHKVPSSNPETVNSNSNGKKGESSLNPTGLERKLKEKNRIIKSMKREMLWLRKELKRIRSPTYELGQMLNSKKAKLTASINKAVFSEDTFVPPVEQVCLEKG